MTNKINLKELANFLVEAKIKTYADANAKEIKAERENFKELEYNKEK